MFNTGKTGPTGGDSAVEPAGNRESVRFDDMNVKKVEKAPKDEKVAYNFAGPKNAGISKVKASSEPAAVTRKNTSEISTQKNLIYISCGHAPGGNNDLEFPAREYVSCFAYVFYTKLYSGNGVNSELSRAMYHVLTGKKYNEVTNYKSKFYILMKSYGITKKSGGSIVSATKDLSILQYYQKYGSKVDDLITKINKFYTRGSTSSLNKSKQIVVRYFRERQAASNGELTALRNTTNVQSACSNNMKCFKIASQSGSSYANKIDEYLINYEYMQAIGTMLSSNGYSIKYSRSSATSNNLNTGAKVTNRNMSTAAAKAKASIHINVHWDASNGKKGLNAYSPNKYGKDIKKSQAMAKAMNAKVGHNVNNASDTYTLLNWSELPTVILECGRLNADDYGKYYNKSQKKRATLAKKWVSNNKDAILAGVQKVAKKN